MRSYASVAAVRKELAPGGPITGTYTGTLGYTSTFQKDFCNYGRTQEPATDTGYTFQKEPCHFADPMSRSQTQNNVVVYKGRNLYGIEEFQWVRSKNRSKNKHPEDPVIYKGKNVHEKDTVLDNGETRLAECPPEV